LVVQQAIVGRAGGGERTLILDIPYTLCACVKEGTRGVAMYLLLLIGWLCPLTGKEEKRESNQGKGFKIVEYAKPPEEEEEEDDDGLKCAICYDLCVRPVTVSLASVLRMD